MTEVNQAATWRENYTMTIKLAFVLVLLGIGLAKFFDGWWIPSLGLLLSAVGFGFLFLAYKIKKKDLS